MSDQRQVYAQMQEALLGFRAHTMRLGDLLERLPELMKQLPEADPTWKAEWVSYWWTLEQVHESAIELGESGRMPGGTRQTVDDAIDGLERLVQGAMAASR